MNCKAFLHVGADQFEGSFVPEQDVELEVFNLANVGVVFHNPIFRRSLIRFHSNFFISQNIIHVKVVFFISTCVAQYIYFILNIHLSDLCWDFLKILDELFWFGEGEII